MIEDLGLYVVAPILSTITAGFLLWFGKTHFRTVKTQALLERRLEDHEDKIYSNMREIEELKSYHAKELS